MLTDFEILNYIKSGHISITPYQEVNLESGNYRLRLGANLLIPKKNQRVSLKNKINADLYDELNIEKQSYVLKPGELVLGQTLEKIGLDKSISAILDGRSTLARLGISIHQASQFIAPGQQPHIITLEIYNCGPFEVELDYDIEIGKLLFFHYDAPNLKGYDEYGKYTGQVETTGAIN